MTLLASEPKQFTLKDDGLIYWQSDATNPLPGEAVARLKKGAAPLAPIVELLETDLLQSLDPAAVCEKIDAWTKAHIARVLEPLMKLQSETDALPAVVSGVCNRVYEGLGIVPRQQLLDLIEGLDADMRKTLRARHVKLGPVLVFVPDLTRPAAVRLRALLWSLFHDKPLPAPVPKDGAVSVVVDATSADPVFYQSIGYPLYANRVIRIDMLDRVISAVYDNVKDNHFNARHEMAEWLGCSIPDLYAVLESMGHKKVSDPAEQKVAAATDDAKDMVAVVPVSDDVAGAAAPVATETSEAPVAAAVDAPVPTPASAPVAVVKPQLASFRVWWPRKAKPAGSTTPERIERIEKRSDHAPANKDRAPRKGFKRDDRAGEGQRRPKKPTKSEKQFRNVQSGPAFKPEDSPFAILSTLKLK